MRTEHLIENKVHGIITDKPTGEYHARSADERLAHGERAKQVVGNRLPLILGTGAIRIEATDYAVHARSIGANAIHVTTPPLCGAD